MNPASNQILDSIVHSPKKYKIILAISVLAAITSALIINYFNSTFTVVVEYENISSARIRYSAPLDSHISEDSKVPERVFAKDIKSGDTVRLKKIPRHEVGLTYELVYEADENYASGIFHNINELTRTVKIKPDYSENYYNNIINSEKSLIEKVISERYPAINNYEIKHGKMYKEGLWYGTTLVWRGESGQNTDTLRIVLRKEGNNWTIASKPDIILTQINNPDIPFEVLSEINKL